MTQGWLTLLLVAGLASAPGCQCKSRQADAPSPGRKAAPSVVKRSPRELRPDVDTTAPAELDRARAALAPLHTSMGPTAPGDWLSENDEPGQTFAEYRQADPSLPEHDHGRHVVYVQPLGALDETEKKVVDLAGDYLRRFFGLPLRFEPALSLDVVPERARRRHPEWGVPQILTSFVLDEVLKPRLPEDAAAMISFTASDLWPGRGYNFVFGQASLHERVGVWSMHRNGDPRAGAAEFRRVLWRTLKTAVHECAHMFSIEHCTAYECVMNGSNSLQESDARPLWLCPECMAKVSWATKRDPRSRYLRLLEFARGQGMAKEAAFFERSIEALRHGDTSDIRHAE